MLKKYTRTLISILITVCLLCNVLCFPIYGQERFNKKNELNNNSEMAYEKISSQLIDKYLAGEEISQEVLDEMNIDPEVDYLLRELIEKQTKKTNRFIIKYKNQQAKKTIKNKLSKQVSSFKKIKNKNANIDVVITKTKMKHEELLEKFKKDKLENQIDYIQPDYQLSFASLENNNDDHMNYEKAESQNKNDESNKILQLDLIDPNIKDPNIKDPNIIKCTLCQGQF